MEPATTAIRKIIWALAGAGLAIFLAATVWMWGQRAALKGGWEEKPLEGLDSFGQVPQFSLTERSGRRISLEDLKGKVWIADFIYTNCPDTCPIQSAQMKQIQDEFKNEKDLRFVSITVDPVRDTPKVLSEYAKRFGADPARWLFLTGEPEAIHRFAQHGFRLGAAEIPHEQRPASGATHTHSPRFVLMDRESVIRGYYPSTDPEAVQRLKIDLQKLLRREE